MNEPTLITYAEVAKVVIGAGVRIEMCRILDSIYSMPSEKWLPKFGIWGSLQLGKLGIAYVEDGFDCDDYSRWFWSNAPIAHQMTAGRIDDGLSIGVFNYVTEAVTGHSIIAAICRETPDRLRFFEPQKRLSEIKLTEKEIKSCNLFLL